jgi:TPP-dependent pyruvate/acetoin dehydrogenase alpha subunit
MRAEAEKTVADALERAMSWDDPAPESRLEDVYA